MRNLISLGALAAALAVTPAAAQINLGGQAGVNANVGLDTGRTLDSVNHTLDRTVETTDRTVNHALDRDVAVATRADVRGGATVRDSRGRRIGTVHSVHGGTAIVVRNGQQLHVPLGSLYRSGRGLVTSLTRAQPDASASADARAGTRTNR